NQSITSGDILINAGSGGTQNFAGIFSEWQYIDVTGSVTLNGGGSASNGGARIGGQGSYAGGAASDTNLQLTTTGGVTLIGGSVSGAAIGSSSAGGTLTNIYIDAGGNVTLNSGASGVRIGSPNTAVAGGDITILS